jgi:hypothetical protein
VGCATQAQAYATRRTTAFLKTNKLVLYAQIAGACLVRYSIMALRRPTFRHQRTEELNAMSLRKFIIERDIPKVGTLERDQLREAATKSNSALKELGTDIQWVESFVAENKTFCVYLAKDEAIIRRHAEISGFPATKITEIKKMIDPTTAAG